MKNQNEISKEWAKRGFSCGLWVDPPGQTWEDYVHDVDEVVYVLQGTLEFEISGKKQTLKPGDEAFIPARANHSVRNIGGSETHWLYGYSNH